MIKKFITASIVILALTGGIIFFIGALLPLPLTYFGAIECDNLDDAYSQKELIIEQSVIMEARMEKINITLSSPPKLTFRVVMTDNEPFPYGNQFLGHGLVYPTIAVFAILFIAIGAVSIWSIFQCIEQEE